MSNKFQSVYEELVGGLLNKGAEVDVGEWHAQDVSGVDQLISRELLNVQFDIQVPDTVEVLQGDVMPNLPWAEEHFQERVSRIPMNPPPSHERWPYARKGNEVHLSGGRFSHTYPERYWPKFEIYPVGVRPRGIAFTYGDLDDLVDLLVRNPNTRQAYLPVWFPEDLTAAKQKQRVPCSLGYHFFIRYNKLHCNYFIRSCDFVRHFRDDVYHTCRLMQWVRGEWREKKDEGGLQLGAMTMFISSLHAFKGDIPTLLRIHNGEN